VKKIARPPKPQPVDETQSMSTLHPSLLTLKKPKDLSINSPYFSKTKMRRLKTME
jgi:hypothetical protein